jgi:hypothetical protein
MKDIFFGSEGPPLKIEEKLFHDQNTFSISNKEKINTYDKIKQCMQFI